MKSVDDKHLETDATRAPADTTAVHDEDPRLLEAVQEYMAAVEAGRRPSQQELRAKYPEIADELSQCIQGLAFVNSAAAQIKAASPLSPDSSDSAIDMIAAKPLGDFKLVREIGRGGMGVVYEAEQLSLGRRVAVKVLSFAAALDPRHLQRFRNEAHAAAQLHHTNIVPVYAVGCERSVHFYAMQLIEGQSLADVIREMRKASGRSPAPRDHSNSAPDASASWHPPKSYPPTEQVGDVKPRGRITSRENFAALTASPVSESISTIRPAKRQTYFQAVARLGFQAAEALDYAHNMGVVHRDIKPANLLLDHRGNLWITDFGLAQFYAADTGLTQTGDLLGTFRYMSPEQASGRAVVLDQRTDVYSLGVTLYELLTLERALPGKTREQLLHEIGSVDPRSPRSIDKSIPAELETILFKAIAKDPSDRYPTAHAFADDLTRFLRDEPIQARPPSVWDKTVKWTRRHKSLALSTMVMLVIIAAGLAVYSVRIAHEQAKTRSAYDLEVKKTIEADKERARAQASFKEARNAVDFLTRVAAEDMGNRPPNEVRKELLEASLAYYQSFIDEERDDPSVSAELTGARSTVSSILTELAAEDDFFLKVWHVRLLRQASVREELNLSDANEVAIQQFAGPLVRKVTDVQRNSQLTTEQKRDRVDAVTRELDNRVHEVLTSEQADRLQQIAWQIGGPDAFSDPSVVDALSLTAAENAAIAAIQSDYKAAWHRTFMPHGPPVPPPDFAAEGGEPNNRFQQSSEQDRQHAIEERQLKAQAVEKIIAVLNPEQVEIWNTMIGRPFNGLILPEHFRKRGGGPGH